MGLGFVDRVIKATAVLAAISFPFLALYFQMNLALAVLFGALWGCLNLWAIKMVIVNLVSSTKPNLRRGLMFLFLKLPILYFAGYLLLSWDYLPTGGLLVGFSGILIVSVLKAFGRLYLGLDNLDGNLNQHNTTTEETKA